MQLRFRFTAAVLGVILTGAATIAQRRDVFVAPRDHAAILYSTAPTTDAASRLNARLAAGTATLRFEPDTGYLRSVLDALQISTQSQGLVFSQTSFQGPKINFHNPRAIYFNDTVSVGWVRGGDVLEVAALDPRQGVIFYAIDQKPTAKPQLTRNNQCLACHLSWETLGVPGLTVQSVHPLPDEKSYVNGYTTRHSSPLEERWGGWFVTGNHGGARHMGNIPVMPADKGKSKLANPRQALTSVTGLFDLKGYPTPYSDVIALMVLEHQAHMTNLITRLGWEARLAAAAPGGDAAQRVSEAVADMVDYMLFVYEAPFAGPMQGSTGFAASFAAAGPRDSKGRSLRELDLRRRLFRYPLSYMIYTEAFDALPASAKDAAYRRMSEILTGRDTHARYAHLTAADRQALIEILRDTKKGLPAYFQRQS
jgi:hypothetical protein